MDQPTASPNPPATRIEEDALGDVHVPAAQLWGAQTERSHENFLIGVERFRWHHSRPTAL